MAKTDRNENGWQYGKTALECHRYMLDHEIATDVCFEVGPPDGTTVNIRAHKYMLIDRSAVFEAMFSSGMTECLTGPESKIRIEDIRPDVFKELLRFIYCDEKEITTTLALELMYAAKKYMLPNLVQLCSECLQRGLTAANVCHILNQSLLFDESALKEKCLDFIVNNSSDVLQPENLQYASHQAVEAILKMDSLDEDETLVYNACINWAKTQLKIHKSVGHPNDQQIREVIGDLIYDIRFLSMDAKAFAGTVEGSTVLSYEEQSTIFCCILNKRNGGSMKFNCGKRFNKDMCVDRSGIIITDTWNSGPDAIDVKSDKTVLVTGLGLLPENNLNGSGYSVDVEILKASVSVLKMSSCVPHTKTDMPYKVAFKAPILLEPGILYTVVASSCPGKKLYRLTSCKPICTQDNVTFTFSTTAHRPNNGTLLDCGQIPQIYFRILK